MSHSKDHKNGIPSKSANLKPPAIKDQSTPVTSTPSRLPGTLHPASSAPPPPKTRHQSAAPARKPSTTTKPTPSPKLSSPQQTPQRKFSATPNSFHLSPYQSRKASVTPKSPSPRKTSATPKPSHLAPSKSKASTVVKSSPPQATPPVRTSPRNASGTPKILSPPKPDWKAPPGKRCSFTSSPTLIPSPVFVSSVRQEVAASPGSALHVGSGIGGLCTPVPAQRRRRGDLKVSSPLVCEVSEADLLGESGNDEEKNEVKGLGLSFQDPFSSTPEFDPDCGAISSNSSIPVSGSTKPRVKSGVGVRSPTSPISPRPRFYTPTSTPTTPTFAIAFTSIATNSKNQQQAEDTKEETPKRDSLSPNLSPTTVTPSAKPTFPSTATTRSHSSRIPHLKYRHLSPASALPPSPCSVHPYTGTMHVTPSCTVGALTHRLVCGHLALTVVPEVCGVNCMTRSANETIERRNSRQKEGNGWERAWRERIERKRKEAEKGFVANTRNLDAGWMCPCCRIVGEQDKGRRCVAVLGGKFR